MSSKVRASHILIKHNESRNPVSRRTGLAVTKSKAAAMKEISDLLPSVTPANFAEVAEKISDCSSCAKGGDLGEFGRGAFVCFLPFGAASSLPRVSLRVAEPLDLWFC